MHCKVANSSIFKSGEEENKNGVHEHQRRHDDLFAPPSDVVRHHSEVKHRNCAEALHTVECNQQADLSRRVGRYGQEDDGTRYVGESEDLRAGYGINVNKSS